MIEAYTIRGGPAVGLAGAATVTTVSGQIMTGRVIGVGVLYQALVPPATTDVTIRGAGLNNGVAKAPILTITNSGTDVWRQPYVLKDDTAGADIAGQYVEPMICDYVEVVVAEADPDDIVDVILLVER